MPPKRGRTEVGHRPRVQPKDTGVSRANARQHWEGGPEADPTLGDAERKALVSRGYDAIAERYTELAVSASESHPRNEQVAQLLKRLSPRSRVLELGCGGAIRGWIRPDRCLLLNIPHHASSGWLEEDFLGLGGTNWTNSYDSGTALQLLERADFVVIDKRQLGEDDLDPERWLWVLARPVSRRQSEPSPNARS